MGIKEVFANNLRIYRKRAGLSQEALGEMCGLHRTYIGGIEQGRKNPSLKNIGKIAKALDVEPALLLMRHHDEDLKSAIRELEDPGFRIKSGFSMAKGDFALCEWTDKGIVITPIRVYDQDLSLKFLYLLMEEGHKDDLASAYEERIDFVTSVFKIGSDKALAHMLRSMAESVD